MTPEQLLKAIFKAYHDILESLEKTGSITGAIPVVATGTTEPRPLKDRFADIVNVKDFGAVGDFDPVTKTGTDNQAAIQSAIEFCAAHGKSFASHPAIRCLEQRGHKEPSTKQSKAVV